MISLGSGKDRYGSKNYPFGSDDGSRVAVVNRIGSEIDPHRLKIVPFGVARRSVRMETTVGMIRTTIHITQKINCAATDVDHAMIHTDRSRDPYGKWE